MHVYLCEIIQYFLKETSGEHIGAAQALPKKAIRATSVEQFTDSTSVDGLTLFLPVCQGD